MSVPATNAMARNLVWRMFRDAADEDYLVARWAALEGLNHQFLWSAQQALEKYLKAALLLNDRSISDDKHALKDLYHKLLPVVGDLLPMVLCPPNYFEEPGLPFEGARYPRWFDFQTLLEFISRVDLIGNPNVRYRQHSITFFGYDLHKFDEVCFLLRRVCVPLDMPYASTGGTYRSVLTRDRRLQSKRTLSFQDHPSTKKSRRLIRIFKCRNFSYFEKESRNAGLILARRSATNSPISLQARMPGEGIEAVKWLLNVGKFRKDEAKELRDFMQRIEQA